MTNENSEQGKFIKIEDHHRVNEIFLGPLERPAIAWLVKNMPEWVTPDHLTFFGLAASILICVSYYLTNFNKNYLWLAGAGFILNWFGDSLDGTLARVRNVQRPIYGFYIDHNIDGLTILIICIGAGLSPFISFSTAMLILAGYLLLSVFTYINTYLKGEFKITYSKLGPTEFRLIVIIINTLFIYFPKWNQQFVFMGVTLKIFDAIGIVIALVLFIIYLIYFVKDKKKYEETDPLHPYYTTKQ